MANSVALTAMTAQTVEPMDRLVVCGLGYTGTAIAELARAGGMAVIGTRRQPDIGEADVVAFADAASYIRAATHLLITAAPEVDGDPVLARHGPAIREARDLTWIGYLSTTGVYGDRGGAWVYEDTLPAPSSPRAERRLVAEAAWLEFKDRVDIDIFRVAGIYGPGRSSFDDLRAGTARRVVKPGHAFGRIHRDDIARAVMAAMARRRTGGSVFNLNDDEPAESTEVVAEAARLLGMEPPPEIAFEQAMAGMSPMARSFWAENRKVSSQRTRETLGIAWQFPTFREGLRGILDHEIAQKPGQGSA